MPRPVTIAASFASALVFVGAAAGTAYATVPATITSLEPAGGATDDPDIYFNLGGVEMTCATAGGPATLASSPASAAPSGTWDATSILDCVGPLGVMMTASSTSAANISILGGGPTTWYGLITGISWRFADVYGGTTCNFDVTGTVGTTYDLPTQTLTISGSGLNVASTPPPSCMGLISSGAISMTGAFTVS